MRENSLLQAKKYYTLIGEKKIEDVKKFLHPDVKFYGPLATLEGKEAVERSIYNFMKSFSSLTIKAAFGDENEAVVLYDVDIPGISSHFPGASYLTFEDDLIVRIQLYYDGSPFGEMKKNIFKST